MNIRTTLFFAGGLAMIALLGAGQAAQAQQQNQDEQKVKVFSSAPSVEELRQILGDKPKPAAIPGSEINLLTRGIVFGDKAKPKPAAPAPELEPGPQSVGMPIEFGLDSAKIRTESLSFLDSIGEFLKADQNVSLIVEGHTDALGSADYNQKLSERRATAVKNYLREKHQIGDDRLKVIGKGESEPLKSFDRFSPENRRVQFRRG